MKIVPVLDLLGGKVVRGVAGRRSEYRPIESRLVTGAEPARVAAALQAFGLTQFYVADLDAIAGQQPAWPIYRELAALGLQLWIDAGVGDVARGAAFAQFAGDCPAVTGVIAGLESLAGPAVLEHLLAQLGAERLIFSLDMQKGRPMTGGSEWAAGGTAAIGLDPLTIGRQAVALGVRRMIVLDLAQVGIGGLSTLDLCRRLGEFSALQLISGGGVRAADDLAAIQSAGCDAALVASALHDGRLTRAALRLWIDDNP
ncbi:MAG TPA: HisA/HisF-related TIM barrel protein [Pirellulales bacterium]|jgi:phosphoribosylformimino-5-aminoimidazole carboxamide ribotide isomerase|nr:HisA/HisF-related TIM barrel protein [Pirellulales bacterium]